VLHDVPAEPPGLELAARGSRALRLSHLVIELNAALDAERQLLPGVPPRITQLATRLACHLITADSHRAAPRIASTLGCTLTHVGADDQASEKAAYVRGIGAARVVAMGNSASDALMLATAELGICVVGGGGAATTSIVSSDVCCTTIDDALDLLIHPHRLVATLRR
jgi:soluble P-type ATPase